MLAGGASRRLGQDKVWADVGGRTVFARILHAAREVSEVVISVADPQAFRAGLLDGGWVAHEGDVFRSIEDPSGPPPRSVRLVVDSMAGRGPLAGLADGLVRVNAGVVIILAGDLPFATHALIADLDRELSETPGADGVVPVVDGRDQPLCAAYVTPRAVTVARGLVDASALETRGPSVADLVAALDVRRVERLPLHDESELRVVTRGIDTPEDLDWARSHASGPPP